jgi:hypothetical protein
MNIIIEYLLISLLAAVAVGAWTMVLHAGQEVISQLIYRVRGLERKAAYRKACGDTEKETL